MRTLTREEMEREVVYRLALRGFRGHLYMDIVRLIAEMIELSRERVPDCYQQRV